LSCPVQAEAAVAHPRHLELLLTTCDVRFRVDVQDLLDLLASFDTDTTICGIGTDVVISEINYNPCSTCAPSASLRLHAVGGLMQSGG
jgi:hypothetical protein